MTNNPYAPPSAPVADVDRSELADQSNPYFAVGLVKLFVMTLVTFGLYEVYWFYRHWRLVKARDRSEIWPIPRGIFAVFFIYQLFKRMRSDGEENNVPGGLAAGPLATVFIIFNVLWRAPEPYSYLSFVTVVILLIAQKYANQINLAAAPEHERNAGFSGWNWFGIVVGGLIWVMAVIGLFLPEEV